MAEPTEFMGLREAFAHTLRLGGTTLLGDPRRLVAYMLDIADQSRPEVRLAAQQINAELLTPLATASRAPSESSLLRARSHIEEVLIRDRFVSETYALTVADCLAGGFADFVGVSLPAAEGVVSNPVPSTVPNLVPSPAPSTTPSAPSNPAPRIDSSGVAQPPIQTLRPKSSSSASKPQNKAQVTSTRNAVKPYQIIAIAAGKSHSVGLRANGTVVAVGDNYYGQCDVGSWSNIVSIAAADNYTLGLRNDGKVLIAGLDKNAVLFKDATAIAAGGQQVICLTKSGGIESVGVPDWYQRVIKSPNWKHVISLAVGPKHIVGLRTNGTVVSVGIDSGGRTSVTNWKNVNAVAAGKGFTLGLRKDGKVLTTANYMKAAKVEDWRDIVSIDAGTSHSLGVTKAGAVLATGSNSSKQCNVGTWDKIVAVAAGDRHSLGLRADGKVLATGANYRHQCDVSSW